MPKSLITYFKKLPKVLIIFLCLQVNIIHANDNPEKLIGVGLLNCPYLCKNSSSNQGFLIEVIKRSFAYSGIKFDYKILSQKEFNKAIKNNEADIFIGTTSKDENLDYLLLNNQPIIKGSFSLYAVNNYISDQKYIDEFFLKNKILGASNKNKFLISELKRYILNTMIKTPDDFVFFDSENTTRDEINALLNGKIDVLLENDDIVNYHMSVERKVKHQLIKIKSFDQKIEFYVSFPKNKSGMHYLDLFEEGFKKLSSYDGVELLKLRKKYGIN